MSKDDDDQMSLRVAAAIAFIVLVVPLGVIGLVLIGAHMIGESVSQIIARSCDCATNFWEKP